MSVLRATNTAYVLGSRLSLLHDDEQIRQLHGLREFDSKY